MQKCGNCLKWDLSFSHEAESQQNMHFCVKLKRKAKSSNGWVCILPKTKKKATKQMHDGVSLHFLQKRLK
jgi:hypothetical protein